MIATGFFSSGFQGRLYEISFVVDPSGEGENKKVLGNNFFFQQPLKIRVLMCQSMWCIHLYLGVEKT